MTPIMAETKRSTCEVRTSQVEGERRAKTAGLGTFASRNLQAGEIILTESPFLTVSCRGPGAHTPSLPGRVSAALASISIHQHNLPPCVRLAATDTGGVLSGSEESFWFAKAYVQSSSEIRAELMGLSESEVSSTHAIVRVVQAEVAILRSLDPEIRAVPQDELERAILRYWANTFGREGSLHKRGSRFNHSCAPNCTRTHLPDNRDDGGKTTPPEDLRAFVALRSIAAGEELTLSYLPSKLEAMGSVVRRRHLWLSRGFLCHCIRCSPPQDPLRQVKCPECPGIKRQRTHRGFSGGRCSNARLDEEREQASLALKEKTVVRHLGWQPGVGLGSEESMNQGACFADWWNQSGIWVCGACGWCSEMTGDFHRREAALSADVFTFVMKQTVHTIGGWSVGGGAETDLLDGERLGGTVCQRRSAIENMLQASLESLGRRHWATCCCLLLRLEQDISLLESPVSPCDTPESVAPTLDVAGVLGDLNRLWDWFVRARLAYPAAHFLFDVICVLSVRGLGGMQGDWETALCLLTRVAGWASVFADKQQTCRWNDCHATILKNIRRAKKMLV